MDLRTYHFQMWSFLAATGLDKEDFYEDLDPQIDRLSCAACTHASKKKLADTKNNFSKCHYCPIGAGLSTHPCLGGLFYKWESAREIYLRRNYAKEIYNLPWEGWHPDTRNINFSLLHVGTPVWHHSYGNGEITARNEVSFSNCTQRFDSVGIIKGQKNPSIACRYGNILVSNRYRRKTKRLGDVKVGHVWSRPDCHGYFLCIAPSKSYDLTSGETFDHYSLHMTVTIHEAKLLIGASDRCKP